MRPSHDEAAIGLPPPVHDGSVAVEAAISRRRSVRRFSPDALELAELSQLLWAAQGVTHFEGYRAAPSAGAIYPLEVYVLVGRVGDLADGAYRYVPRAHQLNEVLLGDGWPLLWSTVLANRQVKESAAVLAITSSLDRLEAKYGERAERYALVEVGHVVQNVYLQAVAMDLATVVVGSFNDADVSSIFGCSGTERPIVMMPVGRPL